MSNPTRMRQALVSAWLLALPAEHRDTFCRLLGVGWPDDDQTNPPSRDAQRRARQAVMDLLPDEIRSLYESKQHD